MQRCQTCSGKHRGVSFLLAVLLVSMLATSCVWPKRRYMEVKKDQTVEEFYKAKGIPASVVTEEAKLELDRVLRKGEKVFVPYEAMTVAAIRSDSGEPKPLAHLLLWPIQGATLSSTFGYRWNRYHEGIDLVAPIGTPIHAAASGEIIYAGNRIGGYGYMIVIKHAGSVATVYAHNKTNLVKKGDNVEKGQKIALLGNSGKASGPHLHFEVRQASQPVDPLLLLPEQKKKWADTVISATNNE